MLWALGGLHRRTPEMATKRLSVGRRGFLKSAVAVVATARVAPSSATAQDSPTTANQNWLALTREAALEPQLAIVDPHHHFWDVADRTPERYLLAQLVADAKGHNLRQTVFIECGSMYRADGPEEFRVVGEPSSYKVSRQRAPAGDMAICAPPQALSVRQTCGWATASRPCSRPRSPQARSASAASVTVERGRIRACCRMDPWRRADPTDQPWCRTCSSIPPFGAVTRTCAPTGCRSRAGCTTRKSRS